MLFIATKVPWAPSSSRTTAATARTVPKKGSNSASGSSVSVSTCSRGDQQDMSLEDRSHIEEADDVLMV